MASTFVYIVYDIVNDPAFDDLICWDKTGKKFHVLNQEKFSKEVLPLYFKHNSMSSFIRQLNMHGFHKIQQTSVTDKDQHQFINEFFQRGKRELLKFIKRKNGIPLNVKSCHSRRNTKVAPVVPSFLKKLWSMVENPAFDECICWSKSGSSFVILQPDKLSWEVLPFYYKHNNSRSFERQLNLYGFQKVPYHERLNLQSDNNQYQHEFFKKGQASLLKYIKARRISKDRQDGCEERSALGDPDFQSPVVQKGRKGACKEPSQLGDPGFQSPVVQKKGVLEIPEHASNVLQSLHDQQKTGKFCDIMFKTATGFISAHRSVIFSGANSLGDECQIWSEVMERSNTIVNIFEEFSQEIVQQLFMLMYTGKVILSSEEDFDNLKKIAVKLRFSRLLKMLSNVVPNSDNKSVINTDSIMNVSRKRPRRLRLKGATSTFHKSFGLQADSRKLDQKIGQQNSKESTAMYEMSNAPERNCKSSDSDLEEVNFDQENTFEKYTDEQQQQPEWNEEMCLTDDSTCSDNSAPNLYMDVVFKEEKQNEDLSDTEMQDGWETVNGSNTVESRCVLNSQSERFKGKEWTVPLPAPSSDTRMSSSETFSSVNTSFSKDTRSVMETEITPSILLHNEESKFDFTFGNNINENDQFSDLPSLTVPNQIEENSEEQEKDTERSEQNTILTGSACCISVDNEGNLLRRSVHVENSLDETLAGSGEVISDESLNGTVPLIDTTEKTFLPLKCGKPNQVPPVVLEELSDVENIQAAKSTTNNVSQHGGLKKVKTEPFESISSDTEDEELNSKETNNKDNSFIHSDTCHSRTTSLSHIKPCSVILEQLNYKFEVELDGDFSTVVVEQNF